MASNAAGETEERVQIIVLEKDEYMSYPNLYPDSDSSNSYPAPGTDDRYPDKYPESSPDRTRNPDPYTGSNRYPDRSGYPDSRYPSNTGSDNYGGGELAGESVTPTSGSTITLECLTYSNIGQMTATWRRADK